MTPPGYFMLCFICGCLSYRGHEKYFHALWFGLVSLYLSRFPVLMPNGRLRYPSNFLMKRVVEVTFIIEANVDSTSLQWTVLRCELTCWVEALALIGLIPTERTRVINATTTMPSSMRLDWVLVLKIHGGRIHDP